MEDEGKDRCSVEREKYYNSLGLSTLEIEIVKREGRSISKEAIRRDMDTEN